MGRWLVVQESYGATGFRERGAVRERERGSYSGEERGAATRKRDELLG